MIVYKLKAKLSSHVGLSSIFDMIEGVKNNDLFFVDFRKLQKHIVFDTFPLPSAAQKAKTNSKSLVKERSQA